ncbi:MAG: hypothetical protein A3J48_02840 [Candidatus Doudnabacteria bacterium RIFCSPHIGHO2_02_FULL_46_11]|uniref:Uncharacterized protein n=1 Tax=Candidatus Doudnabacteria bacterium RIFCSPHIGHO2_02_FULL_46_11 TaxID=1817832 RepID=A0A1F5P5E3_9BACT|nr:MAG: hypothetical protein A3J48_02840 [Candidatus Doudnabacteria bacterium RIFCSPHIGHO2_02_FULL_46_11]
MSYNAKYIIGLLLISVGILVILALCLGSFFGQGPFVSTPQMPYLDIVLFFVGLILFFVGVYLMKRYRSDEGRVGQIIMVGGYIILVFIFLGFAWIFYLVSTWEI